MEKQNLTNWPDLWPSPDLFLGSVVPDIVSLHYISTMLEHQVVVRFKNNYGIKISQVSIHHGLYSVAVLRFYGSHLKKHRLVKNSLVPEMLWCFKTSDVLSVCEEVAQWKNTMES